MQSPISSYFALKFTFSNPLDFKISKIGRMAYLNINFLIYQYHLI